MNATTALSIGSVTKPPKMSRITAGCKYFSSEAECIGLVVGGKPVAIPQGSQFQRHQSIDGKSPGELGRTVWNVLDGRDAVEYLVRINGETVPVLFRTN